MGQKNIGQKKALDTDFLIYYFTAFTNQSCPCLSEIVRVHAGVYNRLLLLYRIIYLLKIKRFIFKRRTTNPIIMSFYMDLIR